MDEGLSPRGLEPRRPVTPARDAAHAPLGSDETRAGLEMQILSTEHFSLLTQRSLVYNEAFTRVGMFLTFLSMSLVALALLSGALAETGDLLIIAVIVLGFDLIVGLATLLRVEVAYHEDMLAVQAMARIRHAYVRLAPETRPYFSTGTNDDLPGVLAAYSGTRAAPSMMTGFRYGISTSAGLATIVVALVAGAFIAVVGLLFGASGQLALVAGATATLLMLAGLTRWGYVSAMNGQRALEVRFPASADEPS
jgi:hypothetical protein